MKSFLKLAILAIAVAFLAFDARGQNPTSVVPDGLPAFLPIGSRQRIMDWAVTNRMCTVAVRLTYTNTAGARWIQSTLPITDGYKFPSYEAFNQFVVTNGVFLYDTYKNDMSPTTSIQFRVRVFYMEFGGPNGLIIDADLGPVSQITRNSFSGVEPYYLAPVVGVTNLQRFSVSLQFDSEQSYVYSWTSTTGQFVHDPYPPHSANLTMTNMIILNEWYSVADAMARMTLANAWQTNVYTQHGDLLVGGRLVMKSPTCLEVSMPRGAEVNLESSLDSVNWVPMEFTLPWYLGTDRASFPIDSTSSSSPSQFYRAFVR